MGLSVQEEILDGFKYRSNGKGTEESRTNC